MRLIWLLAAAMLIAGAHPSFACACCTHTGWRSVHVDTLNDWRRSQLDDLQFARKAALGLGEADAKIKGVTDPTSDYDLAVTREKGRLVFAFKDTKGRTGTLLLAIPNKISVFEVDPRGTRTRTAVSARRSTRSGS